MHTYYIHHSTGFHIVTVKAIDDTDLMAKLNTGAIPEISNYTYLQVYSQNNPDSTYPDISTAPQKLS